MSLSGRVQLGPESRGPPEPWTDADGVVAEAWYAVDGDLMLPGFWPRPVANQYTVAERVSIQVGSIEPVLTVDGHLAPAVNLTFQADGTRATQWLDPRDGTLLAVSAPRSTFGTEWNWRGAGEPGFLGVGPKLLSQRAFPQVIDGSCCLATASLGPEPGDTPTLHLLNTTQGLEDWPNQERNWSRTPGSYEPAGGPELAWDGRLPPDRAEGEAIRFPFSEAWDALNDQDEETQEFVDRHPSWQVSGAVYVQNDRANPNLTGSHWTVYVANQDGDVLVRTVTKREPIDRLGMYEISGGEPVSAPLWAEPREGRVLPYGVGWDHLIAWLEPDETSWRGVWAIPTAGGSILQAAVHFDPRPAPPGSSWDELNQRIALDLETGLLDTYVGHRNPMTFT